VRKDLVIALVTIVIVAAVAFGLDAVRPELEPTPSEPFHPAAAGAASPARANEKVVMHVNGQPVTEREFMLFVQSAPAEQQEFLTTPAGRRTVANELVKVKVLEQEAKRLGIADDPEVTTQVEMARMQITASRALAKLADDGAEERIRAEYEKQKGTAITLRHILIAYQGGAVPARGNKPAPPESEAMARARAIVAKLRSGADFAATAAAESDDEASGRQGGMFGTLRPEMLAQELPPELATAIQKLQPGQIGDPLRTQFGIHIFKVEQPSLEDLRPALRQRVRQTVAEQEVARLQREAKVDLDPKFFPASKDPRQIPVRP
jgi:peptidyl-prolyl cis-trans isomerase C